MTESVVTRDALIRSIEYSNVAHSISRIDGDRELTYVNQAFLDATGYARDEAIGRNCRFLQGPGTDPDAVRAIRRSLAEFKPIEIELLNYKKDGSQFRNYLRMTTVFDSGGHPVAYVGVQSDVTRLHEDQRLEQERRHMEALGRMAGNVSHEIKNALQPVKLMADLLQDWRSLTDEERAKCVAILGQSVGIADGIVRDVLTYARKPGAAVETIAVEVLKPEAIRFVRQQIPESVEFEVDDAAPTGDWSVEVRRSHLLQVLLNLVNNAVDAMAGRGKLALLWRHENVGATKARQLSLNSGPHLVLGVRDTGPGIDAKHAAQIFSPFFSTKPPGEGTGLGLSISTQIVKASNGALDFVSEPDAGTTFSIYLPMKPIPAAVPGAKT
jgi:PAS domain S-box-containing protein